VILRRLTPHIRDQNWTAVAIDFVIVVLGVYVGLQVNLWNEARVEAARRQQIIDALVTSLNDSVGVQERFVAEIGTGMTEWEAAYARGERPPPFFYRLDGSDVPPDVWSTFQQMQLAELFDAATLFDLMFFYSEANGIGQKYVRYVTFVEDEILPGLVRGNDGFYDADGHLQPGYRANMDRLVDYQLENERMTAWARCLVYRLESKQKFRDTCRRSGFRLEGMVDRPPNMEAMPPS
jgi:hypothetical protein